LFLFQSKLFGEVVQKSNVKTTTTTTKKKKNQKNPLQGISKFSGELQAPSLLKV
jgi:hypothetical protein